MNKKHQYTLKNMPQECRALYDAVYANQGQPMNIHYFCHIMGLNSALVEDRSQIQRLLYIHSEVKKNIWASLDKQYINGVIHIMDNGQLINANDFYISTFIPYCDQHKVLRWRCGTGNIEYIFPRNYYEEQIYFQREIVIKAFQLIHKVEEGKEWDYLIDKTHKKVLDTFFPIYDTIRRNVLDGQIAPLRSCPTCNNVTTEKICSLCGGNTY